MAQLAVRSVLIFYIVFIGYVVNSTPQTTIHVRFQQFLKDFRRRLADEHALLPLSFLGIFTGLFAGIVIQAFRLLIEWPSVFWNSGGHEAFELLTPAVRMTLPIYGALSLGLFLQFVIKRVPTMGLSHVIQRMGSNHGRLPAQAAILQFLVGIWCILTGQSSGREGPGIHLGAAASSYIGQFWKLPNNSIRVLTGCGTAAAIAASFNTPIAGVIFAMEVVMMEYTIAGFIPIMLAASAGTVISHIVYGDVPAFIPPTLIDHTLVELPAYISLGVGVGVAAGLFCFIHAQGLRLHRWPLSLRFTLAGVVTGCFAYLLPQVMGIGYDTLDLALQAQLGLFLLLAIGFGKILTAAFTSGMGMPIGIIGPTLVAGGCLGGATGIIINFIAPATIANDSLYVMLGMGAMMGAVMNAPLAALTALLELTHSPEIVLPAMIAIVIANLTNTQILKQKSPHVATLDSIGKHTHLSAFDLALQRIGVSSLMNNSVRKIAKSVTKLELLALIEKHPRWVVVESRTQATLLLSGRELEKGYADSEELIKLADDESIDILAIPGEQIKIAKLDFQASAFEAWQLMEKDDVGAVMITGTVSVYAPFVSGIITRHDIDNYYHRPRKH